MQISCSRRHPWTRLLISFYFFATLYHLPNVRGQEEGFNEATCVSCVRSTGYSSFEATTTTFWRYCEVSSALASGERGTYQCVSSSDDDVVPLCSSNYEKVYDYEWECTDTLEDIVQAGTGIAVGLLLLFLCCGLAIVAGVIAGIVCCIRGSSSRRSSAPPPSPQQHQQQHPVLVLPGTLQPNMTMMTASVPAQTGWVGAEVVELPYQSSYDNNDKV